MEQITYEHKAEYRVVFYANCYSDNNGIGCYEYAGSLSIDNGQNYVDIEGDIEWDMALYTDEENKEIASILKRDREEITASILKAYKRFIQY